MSDPTRNPRGIQPNTTVGLGEVGHCATTNLVESLGAVADDIRQIAVELGLRPYQVHAVRLRWTGGQVGRGTSAVVFDEPLLPTPEVVNMGSVSRDSKNAGTVERGDVRLQGISPRYTEDQIVRYFSLDLRSDEEGFIEIHMDKRDGETERRRFVVARAPERRADKFDLSVVLRKQDKNRARRV